MFYSHSSRLIPSFIIVRAIRDISRHQVNHKRCADSIGWRQISFSPRVAHCLPNSFPFFPGASLADLHFATIRGKLRQKFSKIVPARKTHVLSSRRIFFPSGALACLLHQYLYQDPQNRCSPNMTDCASPCSSALMSDFTWFVSNI